MVEPALDGAALRDAAAALSTSLVAHRRAIHQHPELGLDNPRTQRRIVEALEPLGYAITTGRALSSVTATLTGSAPGADDGPAILLRADTDALPMEERNDDPWRSQVPGCAHTCGHDAHVAMLLTAAEILAARRHELAGTVRLVFQPGEEGFAGAATMIEEGALDLDGGRRVDAAFAIHVSPNVPSGWIATRAGPLLAATDDFAVTVTGRGAHASTPHFGNDPLPVACEMVGALATFVGRRVDAFDPAVLTVGRFQAGTTTNVIAPSAEFAGTIRTVSEPTRKTMREGLRRVVDGIAAAHDCQAAIDLQTGYPVTVNDATFVEWLTPVAETVLGPSTVFPLSAPVMGAEDFAYVLGRVPGAMVFLGVCPAGIANSLEAPSCHSDLMRLDEASLHLGAALHAAVALAYCRRRATG